VIGEGTVRRAVSQRERLSSVKEQIQLIAFHRSSTHVISLRKKTGSKRKRVTGRFPASFSFEAMDQSREESKIVALIGNESCIRKKKEGCLNGKKGGGGRHRLVSSDKKLTPMRKKEAAMKEKREGIKADVFKVVGGSVRQEERG